MGNFLVILNPEPLRQEASKSFEDGLAAAKALKRQSPSKRLETPWALAASFPRQDGSGSPVFSDPQTGNWILTAGTWFHSSGNNCDDECSLLRRCFEVGPSQLALEMEGFFTVVVCNAQDRELVVITDVVGSCQCFMRAVKGGFALAGSSLLLASLEPYTLDPVACQEFVHTGIIYEDRTIYKEVRKLGPASVVRFAVGALKGQSRYWNPAALEPDSLDGDIAVERLWQSLRNATCKVTRRFAKPVCDLTGGYDSRVMVAGFLANGAQVATTVSGPDDSPDVIVSCHLAELLKLPHEQFPPQYPTGLADLQDAAVLTDGEYDLVEYSRTLAVHKALSQRFDVSVNGSFGEVARGYWWEILIPQTGKRMKLDPAKLARQRYAPRAFTPSLFRPELRLDLVPHFTGIVERSNAGLFSSPNTFQMDNAYLVMRMQRWQGRIASSTNQLWPCLSPFMFRSVLETMLQTKASFRKRSLLIRTMLARFQPELANVPLEHGYPAVRASWKTLHRFWPLATYYIKRALERSGVRHHQGAQAPFDLGQDSCVQELLNAARMKSVSLFDAQSLATFLAQSRRQGLARSKEWGRLLSLEVTLQRLAGG